MHTSTNSAKNMVVSKIKNNRAIILQHLSASHICFLENNCTLVEERTIFALLKPVISAKEVLLKLDLDSEYILLQNFARYPIYSGHLDDAGNNQDSVEHIRAVDNMLCLLISE